MIRSYFGFPPRADRPHHAPRVPRLHPVRRPAPDVAVETGPLTPLQGRRVLVLADVENLRCGARDLGFKLSFRFLAEKLEAVAGSCTLHAFFSRQPGDDRLVRYFSSRGWVPHPHDIEVVRTYRGEERHANSDNLILFTAGLLVSRSTADVVVLGSGDGTLVSDLAHAVRSLPRPRGVVTLSLARSTSWRLEASKHTAISANVEIGRDCLRPLDRWR